MILNRYIDLTSIMPGNQNTKIVIECTEVSEFYQWSLENCGAPFVVN